MKRSLIALLIAALVILLGCPETFAADFFVQQTTGDDANLGDDWGEGHALATIGRAIDLAGLQPGADIIRVSQGNYVEHLILINDVTLYGAYPPDGGHDRDPDAYLTIIDGGGANNAANLILCTNVVIDGFVIQNGRVVGRGGGLYIENSTGVVINQNVIRNNESVDDWGGGIAVVNSEAQITDNTITGNSTNTSGGGLSFWNNCTCAVRGNTITENRAHEGGGIIQDTSDVLIENNTIVNNQADSDGGGLYLATCHGRAVSDNIISGNIAALDGGGVLYEDSTCGLTDNYIFGNQAGGWGGGINIYGSTGDLVNNLVVSNQAATGGGISLYNGAMAGMLNSTIADNTAVVIGGGLHCQDDSGVVLRDDIFWGNQPDQISDHSGTAVNAAHSTVQDGWPGLGNLNTDPQFVSGYYLSQLAAGNSVDSSCLDAGSNTAVALEMDQLTTRIDGQHDSGQVDMGYHYPLGLTYAVEFIAGVNGGLDGNTFQIVRHGGATTPVTAVPDAGYRFAQWTGDYQGVDNPLTLTNVIQAMIVTAQFVVGNAPTAYDRQVSLWMGQSVQVGLEAEEPDGLPLTFRIEKQPEYGELTGQPPLVTYTPAPMYLGRDSFTFIASNGQSDSNEATVFLDIKAQTSVSDSGGCIVEAVK